MPNTVVKLINAESTRPEAAREDRKLLIKRKRTFRDGCPFLFVNLQEIFLLFFYVWEVGANCSADVLSHSAAAPQLKSVRVVYLRLFPFMGYESMVVTFLLLQRRMESNKGRSCRPVEKEPVDGTSRRSVCNSLRTSNER